jgi:NAD(P)-dependent dehydrogenase (short-subunit alcohol dehydrogenase family)
MDVTDEESMSAGVKQILAETGRIDVLVNNAGYGSYGALEDVPLDEARRQFEVNVFGAARLAQLVLPVMRAQHSGTIVNITSVGGKIHTPLGSWYHGTKFALEAVSDCLRLETKPFGINVMVIEPGGIRSEWGGIAAEHLRETSATGAYAAQAQAVATSLSSETTARRIGRRRTLAIGLVLFGVGSAIGGAAPDFGILAAARTLQGVGGALLAPAALGTVIALFTAPAERARAFSVFGTIAGMGAAAGLLAGGLLTETHGWSAPITCITLTTAAVLLLAFGWWQTRSTSPLVPLRIFADRNRAASLVALLMVNVGIFAAFLFLTYYMQQSLHYTPVKTGAAFLPIIGGMFAGSAVALNVLPRLAGPRVTVPSGMLTAAASLLWLTTLDAHTAYAPVILTGLTGLGVGIGVIFPVASNLGTAGLHSDDHGVGGALVNTTQQVGGSVGVALLSTLSASAATSYLATHRPSPATIQLATLHGYSVAYLISAAVFVAGGALTAVLYRGGVPGELRSRQVPMPG